MDLKNLSDDQLSELRDQYSDLSDDDFIKAVQGDPLKDSVMGPGATAERAASAEGVTQSAYGPGDAILDFASGGEYRIGKGLASSAAERLGLPSVISAPLGVATGSAAAYVSDKALSPAMRASGKPLPPENLALNTMLGSAAADTITTPADAALKTEAGTLADPATQAALREAGRNNPALLGGQNAADISRITPGIRDVIQGQGAIASRDPVEAIGLKLGTAGDSNSFTRGLTEQWQEKGQAIINDPDIFKVKTVPQLATLAGQKAESVAAEKTTLVQQMDESGKLVPLTNVLDNPAIDALNDQIVKLAKSSETRPFAITMKAKLDSLKADLGSLQKSAPDYGTGQPDYVKPEFTTQQAIGGTDRKWGVKPSDLNALNENINLYRREFLQEFEKAGSAAVAKGDQPLGLDESVAVRAFSQIQDALTQPLGPKYAELNAKYGGYSSLEELAHNQSYQTLQGLATRSPTRIVQNAGQLPTQSAFDLATGGKDTWISLAREKLAELQGAPNAAQRSFSQNANRDSNIMDNIRDTQTMQQNPGVLTGAQAGPGIAARTGNGLVKAGAAGVGSAASGAIFDPRAAQAGGGLPLQQDPYPAGLPRQTSDIDPGTFLTQFMDKTQGNPVAAQMAMMFQSAFKDGDKAKLESIHEGMTLAFPGVFEKGWGVQGKIRNYSEQKRYMGRLYEMQAQGQVPLSFIASQQSAFNDEHDKSLLVLPSSQPSNAAQNSSLTRRYSNSDGTHDYNY